MQNYYDLRKEVAKIIPRTGVLQNPKRAIKAVKEKGRKKDYQEFNLVKDKWVKQEKLLNTEEINSFLEISCRAAACPMPLNLDVWDGFVCVAKGQLVITQKGKKPIEKIKIGDFVLSLNEKSKKLEWKEVTKINSTLKENMVDIETDKGILTVTNDHPIYTQRGWVKSEDLKISDTIYTIPKKRIPWNRGFPRTEKEKENISKGISKESRIKSSKRMKRRWKNGIYKIMYGSSNPSARPEVGAKIGIANRGRIVKEETREKLRLSHLGKPGNKISKERRKLYSKRMKINNPMFNKEILKNHPILTSGRYFVSLGEKKLSKIFQEMKLRFYHQEQIAKKIGYYTVDFFFPKYSKIIEFDGHHSHREHPEKDIERDKYIKETYDFDTLRIIPVELNNTNISKTIIKIRDFLNGIATT